MTYLSTGCINIEVYSTIYILKPTIGINNKNTAK